MTQKDDPDADVLKRRLDEIEDGLRKASWREVARLRRMDLPVHVADNGRVVERPDARGS